MKTLSAFFTPLLLLTTVAYANPLPQQAQPIRLGTWPSVDQLPPADLPKAETFLNKIKKISISQNTIEWRAIAPPVPITPQPLRSDIQQFAATSQSDIILFLHLSPLPLQRPDYFLNARLVDGRTGETLIAQTFVAGLDALPMQVEVWLNALSIWPRYQASLRRMGDGPAELRVAVDPPGSLIYLNSELVGVSPMTLKGLSIGPQQLSFSQGKDDPYRLNEDVILTPQPLVVERSLDRMGKLKVDTKPIGARITLSDRALGASPLRLLTDPGSYQLRVEADGYRPVNETLSIFRRDLSIANIQLDALPNLSSLTALIPSGEVAPGLEVRGRFLTGQWLPTGQTTALAASIAGLEGTFGWIDWHPFGTPWRLAASASIYGHAFFMENNPLQWQVGPAGKIRLLDEDQEAPLSLAAGGYWDAVSLNWPIVYVAASRRLGPATAHIALQSAGVSIGVHYNGIYRLSLGAYGFLDFGNWHPGGRVPVEQPMLGLSASYRFF